MTMALPHGTSSVVELLRMRDHSLSFWKTIGGRAQTQVHRSAHMSTSTRDLGHEYDNRVDRVSDKLCRPGG